MSVSIVCYVGNGTYFLADLKGRRRFVPPLKSSAGSSKSGNCAGSSKSADSSNPGHCNGTGAGSSNSGADSEAPRYTCEKEVRYICAS